MLWLAAALPLLAACASDSALEDAAALAVLDSQGASLAALGQAPLPTGRGVPRAAGELVGAAPAVVLGRLGQPRLRRREGAAEVWLYSAAGCQLDLVFYATPNGQRVLHAQARAGGLVQRTEAACLRDIAAEGQRAGPPGR